MLAPWKKSYDQPSQHIKKQRQLLWKDWCWSWNSNPLATWCKEPTHWKRSWCWERLMAGREGDDRGWDGWMASPTWWIWVWVSSGSWWWTGKPGVLQSMGSQRVGHDWVTKLNWTFTFIQRLFSSFSLSAIRLMSSAYLRLLIFLLATLTPACALSSTKSCMLYSA